MLAGTLGRAAVDAGHRMYFSNATELVRRLRVEARRARTSYGPTGGMSPAPTP
ncbi:hypothetical protein [Streptomyces sp. NPDC001135]